MKKLLLMFLLAPLSALGMSQTLLTGVIYDENNLTVAGASVFIKGTTNGTMSGTDGKFLLETEKTEGILVVSFIGFETVEEDFASPKNFTIRLITEKTSLEEVLVIGYGSIKKKDATTAVSSVQGIEKISSRPVSSPQDFFQGSLAGVTVQQQGGDPSKQASVRIRGMGTLNNESPLWVVDGMPYYGQYIDPNNIESITVLKDAASAAIYGAQAASGVIVVTTKSGKAGQTSLSINTYTGIQQAVNLPTPLTAQEQNLVYNTAADNSGKERNAARDISKNSWGKTNRTNWINEIFRNAAIHNTSVALRGGNEKGIYSASFNYQNKEGILIGTSAKKIGLRLKSKFKIGEKIDLGQNFHINNQESVGANTSSSYSGAIINAIYMPSAAPVYDSQGNFHGVAPKDSKYAGAYGDVYNPVALLLRPTTKNPITNIDANFYGTYKILQGLKFRSSFTLNQQNKEYKKFTPKIPESGRPSEMNYLEQSWARRNKWVWDNQISFSKKIGEHQLDFTGVHSAQYTKNEENEIRAKGFGNENDWHQYLENAEEIQEYKSQPYDNALVSLIGRLSYNYKERYFLSASIRKDRSSKLAKENQSDIFPAASVAWKISNEDFMQTTQWLYSLKIRASWGQIGNIQSVGYYAYNVPMPSQRPTMGAGDAKKIPGYYIGQISNPKLKWEKSESTNIGIDLALLEGQVEITADVFQKRTKDMILTNATDPHIGVPKGPTSNIGTVENKGFELSMGYKGNKNGFKYSISGNLSSIKNQLKNLDGYTNQYVRHDANVRSTLYPYRSGPGQELFSYYLISCEGTFKSQKEIDTYTGPNGTPIQPNAKPGDLKFRDQNKDGKIDNNDRTYMGNSFPDFTYGLNLSGEYKNFDLSLTFQGVSGTKIFNGYKFTTYNAALQGYNLDNRVMGAWSKSNSGSNIPIWRTNDPNANFNTASDWYLEDGSYFRMKNITLGYSFRMKNIFSKPSTLRFYLSCENLFTLTEYSGLDPEVGGIGLDMGTYPLARVFTAGISLKL